MKRNERNYRHSGQSLAEWRGEDYIWQMYRDSPPLIWQTAFLNKRIFKIPNCFYSAPATSP